MPNISPRRMKLGFNIVANGAHVAGWRMPGARADAAMDIRLWKDMARAAERACIHFMFWADGIAEAFAYLHQEGGASFNLTLHPWITGQAHRIRWLREALTRVLGLPGIWRTTTDALAAQAREQL